MNHPPTLLAIGLTRGDADALRAAIATRDRAELLAHPGLPDDLAALEAHPPVMAVIAAAHLPAFRALGEKHRKYRRALVVGVIEGSGAEPAADSAPWADTWLPSPVPVALVRGLWDASLRLATQHHRLDGVTADLGTARDALAVADEYVMRLIAAALEFAEPGAAERGREGATLARRIADRFEVPSEFLGDLDRAVRLQGIGRALAPGRAREKARGMAEAWADAMRTRDVLRAWPGLRGAAELIEAMCENWDGTGQPGHVRQGQIPLRSRILRVVTDFQLGLMAGPRGTEAVLDEIDARAGTHYDPMVTANLRQVLASDTVSEARVTSLPVPDLGEGMVLAEDLYTDGGVKLLARGTVLSAAALQIIQRRHQLEPLRNVAIRRSPGGGSATRAA